MHIPGSRVGLGLLAIGAFSIGEHEMATGAIAISAITGIWAAFKWFKSQIKEQVDELGAKTKRDIDELTKETRREISTVAEKTALEVQHHNAMVVARLNAQDAAATANRELLIEKIGNALSDRHGK